MNTNPSNSPVPGGMEAAMIASRARTAAMEVTPSNFTDVEAAVAKVTELRRRRLTLEHLVHTLRNPITRKRLRWWDGLLWFRRDTDEETQQLTRHEAHLLEDWLWESELPRLAAEISRLERSFMVAEASSRREVDRG